MTIRVMASRHSAFYSPLLTCVQFLRKEGHDVPYSVMAPGQRGYALLRDGAIDVLQSAVSSNWKLREQGIEPLPVHFAQINQRDGFFLVGREPEDVFDWQKLEGRTLLADHGAQPLVMLKYAIRHNRADWNQIRVLDRGTPERIQAAFRDGTGDYLHAQAPITTGHVIASVGACMPPVAFSSVCCARSYQDTQGYHIFLEAFRKVREWVQSAPPFEIAGLVAEFFPDTPQDLLGSTIARYQSIGCWQGSSLITRELYEQALNVFQAAGAIAWRHRYEEIVG